MLAELLADASSGLRFSEHFAEPGPDARKAACRLEAEGVVSKRVDRAYPPGNRGVWVKSKCLSR